MNGSGKQIGDSIRAMRGFLADVGHLLRQADAAMADKDWQPNAGNSEVVWFSRSINHPESWLPNYIIRSYTAKSRPACQIIVSVLLGRSPEGDAVEQPLVSSGWFDYGESHAVVWDDNKHELAYLHLHMKKALDGLFAPLTAADTQWLTDQDILEVERGATSAVPLTDITDRKSLADKVIVPLLTSLAACNARQSERIEV